MERIITARTTFLSVTSEHTVSPTRRTRSPRLEERSCVRQTMQLREEDGERWLTVEPMVAI